MIHVTWEWLGQGLALDLADTVTIEDGVEHDLIASPRDFQTWAEREAELVPGGSVELLRRARRELLDLRTVIRDVLGAVSAEAPLPSHAVGRLNRASRAAPTWLDLDAGTGSVRRETSASAVDALVAAYARSAMELVAEHPGRLRRCPAPSCGMFYVSRREQQRWCSTQCGTRARVARHYRSRRAARA